LSVAYRRRPGNEVARQISGSWKLETAWTLIPAGLAMIPFFWGATLYLELSSPPDDALDVRVVARQWMWKAEHPDGQAEIDELHVPVGQPVRLTMISQDVIHRRLPTRDRQRIVYAAARWRSSSRACMVKRKVW
jgi:cytochrome c oxidase subunit 2